MEKMKDHEILLYYIEQVRGHSMNSFAKSYHPNALRESRGGTPEQHQEYLKLTSIRNTVESIIRKKKEITATLRGRLHNLTGLWWEDIKKEVEDHRFKLEGPGQEAQRLEEENEKLRMELVRVEAQKDQLEKDFDKLLTRVKVVETPFKNSKSA